MLSGVFGARVLDGSEPFGPGPDQASEDGDTEGSMALEERVRVGVEVGGGVGQGESEGGSGRPPLKFCQACPSPCLKMKIKTTNACIKWLQIKLKMPCFKYS